MRRGTCTCFEIMTLMIHIQALHQTRTVASLPGAETNTERVGERRLSNCFMQTGVDSDRRRDQKSRYEGRIWYFIS